MTKSSTVYSKQEIRTALKTVAKRLGTVPSRSQYRNRKNMSMPASSTVEEHFGSWRNALRGVRF